MTTDIFKAVRAQSYGFNEYMDCSVKAVTIATGLDYAVVHAAFKEAGRKDRSRTPLPISEAALKSLGYEFDIIDCSAKTVTTLEKHLDSGSYIAFVRGHMLAIRDGVVHDWSEGTRKRIRFIWKITKKTVDKQADAIATAEQSSPIATGKTKVKDHKGGRIWLEGKKVFNAGFTPQTEYYYTATAGRLIISQDDMGIPELVRLKTVSGNAERSIIDICATSLGDCLGLGSSVDVQYFTGMIVVSVND